MQNRNTDEEKRKEALAVLIEHKKMLLAAAVQQAVDAKDKAKRLAEAKVIIARFLNERTRTIIQTSPNPYDAAVAIMRLHQVRGMLTNANLSVIEHHPEPFKAANTLIEIRCTHQIMTDPIRNAIKNNVDSKKLMSIVNYQKQLEAFLQNQMQRIPLSYKYSMYKNLLTQLRDNPNQSMDDLKSVAQETKKVAESHRDTGLTALVKFCWLRETSGAKEMNRIFTQDMKLRSAFKIKA